jgi:alpha-1,6-mannosyltransferase
MTVAYIWLERKLKDSQPPLKLLLSLVALLSLILLFTFPLGASDLFFYISQARVWSIHHLNPYTQTYLSLSQDLFYPFLKNNFWANTTSPYGPLFVLTSGGLSWLARNSLFGTLLIFKLGVALAHLFNVWLMDKTLGRRASWLYGLNPLIIFEFLVNGHNEVLLISFTLLAFYFFHAKKNSIQNGLKMIAALVLGVLIKFISLPLIPFWALAYIKKLNKTSQKIIFISGACLLTALIACLIYLPFWQNWNVLAHPITNQMRFTNKVLVSPLILALYHFFQLSGNAISWSRAVGFSQLACLVFLAVLSFGVLKNFRRLTPTNLFFSSVGAMAVMYFCFFSWLMPWYLTFFLLLLIINYSLKKESTNLLFINALTILGIFFYSILR